jgi:hypothetical protein
MRIKSTYDENYIAALKAKIDYSARKWDKDKKEWVIELRYRKAVMSLLKRFFEPIIEENEPPKKQKSRTLGLPPAFSPLVKLVFCSL